MIGGVKKTPFGWKEGSLVVVGLIAQVVDLDAPAHAPEPGSDGLLSAVGDVDVPA